MLKRYRRRERTEVSAVKLSLETQGFTYLKWGSTQSCTAGDWLVDNQGEVYTVAAASFALTYERVSPGRYVKHAPVWAEQATSDGAIATQEGQSAYRAGDYVVYNQPDRSDGYAIEGARFHALYVLAEDEGQ